MVKIWLRKGLKLIVFLLGSLTINIPIYVYRQGTDSIRSWTMAIAIPYVLIAALEPFRAAGRMKNFFAARSFDGMLFRTLLCSLPYFANNLLNLISPKMSFSGLQYGMFVGLLTPARYATIDRPDAPNIRYWRANSTVFGLLAASFVFFLEGRSQQATVDALLAAVWYAAGLWLGLFLGNYVQAWIAALKPTFDLLRKMGRTLMAFGVGYVAIIIMFGTFYAALLRVEGPDAFSGMPQQLTFSAPLYLSVVTATTVGYGDIAPRSGPARMLTSIESLMSLGWTLIVFAAVAIRFGDFNAKNQSEGPSSSPGM
jgi:hypothetical protein